MAHASTVLQVLARGLCETNFAGKAPQCPRGPKYLAWRRYLESLYKEALLLFCADAFYLGTGSLRKRYLLVGCRVLAQLKGC